MDYKTIPINPLSGSTIKLTGIHGGDIHPGDSIKVEANIINNGKEQEDNIRVKLILSDHFKTDDKDSWQIVSLEAGGEEFISTEVEVMENLTSDADAWCRLQIASDNIRPFTLPEYHVTIYEVKEFERHYIPIIAIHAVEDDIEIPIELYTSYFDDLCSTLKDFGFETITFMDLLGYLDHGKALPEKPVIITSDDGYQDIYTNAFPILKKYDYKMTVFLITGFIGNSNNDRKVNYFDIDRHVPMRPMLTWPEVIDMYEYGCEFQSHSVNHIRLGTASDEDFLYELTQSKKDIESHLENQVLFFAWPYGNYSSDKLSLIPEAGYRGAVRHAGGIEDVRTINLKDIKRVEFNSYISPQNYAGFLELFDVAIENKVEKSIKETGEEFNLTYFIKNNDKEKIYISSLELELPDGIEFVGIGSGSYIDQNPGMSRGMYMWVSDDYTISGKSEINFIVNLRPLTPGKFVIKFRITTNYVYIDSDDVEIEVR